MLRIFYPTLRSPGAGGAYLQTGGRKHLCKWMSRMRRAVRQTRTEDHLSRNRNPHQRRLSGANGTHWSIIEERLGSAGGRTGSKAGMCRDPHCLCNNFLFTYSSCVVGYAAEMDLTAPGR